MKSRGSPLGLSIAQTSLYISEVPWQKNIFLHFSRVQMPNRLMGNGEKIMIGSQCEGDDERLADHRRTLSSLFMIFD